MDKLTIINHDGTFVVDSREVAVMVDKRHDHLLRDINGYVDVIATSTFTSTEPKFGVSDFFVSHVYQDSTGRTLPCYLLTRKGCDMVANKMTGEKGVLFTAVYVTKFESMEKALTKPKLPQNYAEALRELANVWEENQLMIPKAQYFDALVERNLLTNFRDTAKELKVKETTFIQWLLEKKYIYRDQGGKLKPYAEYVPSLFEMKEWERSSKAGNQTLITPRGRETFRLLLQEKPVLV